MEANGVHVGYLVSYGAIPIHAQGEVARRLPTGSHRIQGVDFEELGYVTPDGEVCRYTTPGESESVGFRDNLNDGLAIFFGGATVNLRPIGTSAAN